MENIDDNFYKIIKPKKINTPTDNNSRSGFTGVLGITGYVNGNTGPTGNTGQYGQSVNNSCIGTTGPTGPIHSNTNNDKCNHIHFLYQ